MNIKAFAIVPCTRDAAGEQQFQFAGPNLSTSRWSVHRRFEDGTLEWQENAHSEFFAHQRAGELATQRGVSVEPYAWAPTALLTACEFALRSMYGIDLFDAGVQSEADLLQQGVTAADMAREFALGFGARHALERIDI